MAPFSGRWRDLDPALSQTEPRATPYTTEEFDARLRAPGNGQGDLYEVALSAVGLAADTAASR